MHILTVAAAGDSTTPPEPATPETGAGDSAAAEVFMAVWDWLASLLPGGNLTLLGLLVGIGWMAQESSKRKKTKTEKEKTNEAIEAAFKAFGRGLLRLGRFVVGKELRGEPRSDAKFLRAGRRDLTPEGQVDVASMASIALAPPKVSLVKKPRRQPRPWALKFAAWIEDYDRWGARALDWVVSAALWAVWATHRAAGAVRAAYGVVAPPVRRLVRVLGLWRRWPYALRGLARLAVIAALVGLYVPAWRGWTVLGMVAALALLVALSALWNPPEPGDDEVYGPRLWALLADDLKLPDDAVREEWLKVPERLAADGARVVIRLPWTFRGSELERQAVTDLLNSRLPGEWVGRYSFRSEHPAAVYTHKPPPKPPAPEPEPPAAVDLLGQRMQEAIEAAPPETYILGIDENDEIVALPLVGAEAHIAVSVGTGGGKSALLQSLATQVVRQRGTIVGVDPKMVSLRPLKGIEGVFLYNDPGRGRDMRRALEWVADVVEARFYEMVSGVRKDFPPLFLYMEESNELTGILKAVWMKTKDKDDPAQDPIWEAVAGILRKGRQVNVHAVAVFQDLKDTDFSGVSLGLLFPVKLMGAYAKKQWDRIVGSNVSMPPSERKPGRLVGVKNGQAFRFQAPYAIVDNPDLTKDERDEESERRIHEHCRELRATYGWDREGLYSTPPEPSERRVPALLKGASRDESQNGTQTASEGGLSGESAGQPSHQGAGVTPSGGHVTGQRDGLRLIPGQGGREAGTNGLEPPKLLTLAEVARELEAFGYDIQANTMRQHKRRRENTGFPAGVEINGNEKFTVEQIVNFYQKRGTISAS